MPRPRQATTTCRQGDGIEATRQVTAMTEGTARVIVLTTFGHDEYAYEALWAGASGFLLKRALIVTLTAGRLLVPGWATSSAGTSMPVVFLPVWRIVVRNLIAGLTGRQPRVTRRRVP